MTQWILFVIVLAPQQYFVKPEGMFATYEECFQAREFVVQKLGRPIINYQAVCIQREVEDI